MKGDLFVHGVDYLRRGPRREDRPVVGVCAVHDQGCCRACPSLGCRGCGCRRADNLCEHSAKSPEPLIGPGGTADFMENK